MLSRTLLVATLLVSAGAPTVQAQQCPGGVSSKFVVTGDVTKSQIFDLDQLTQKYSPAQENVTYFAAGSVVTESFTGVLLWDLLSSSPVNGIVTNPNIKNDILHKVIIVTGTDWADSTDRRNTIFVGLSGDTGDRPRVASL